MTMRSRRAWLLTLVLLLELAVLCCACAHIACHHCDHGPRCAVCGYVRLGLRGAFLLPAAALTRLILLRRADGTRATRTPRHFLTLIDKKVQLND